MHRYFDLHPRACWDRGGKKGSTYPKWLAQNTVPIYLQQAWKEVPASVQYPRGRILTEFSYAHRRRYFSNHAAWMIALAITEGATHIALYGINYGTEGEYVRQRGSAEYWLGQLDGRGIVTILPEQCTLLADPVLLYGYESHDEQTGMLKPEYKRREWSRKTDIVPLEPGQVPPKAQPPAHLVELIAQEEAEHPRPDWARPDWVPEVDRTDGESRRNA